MVATEQRQRDGTTALSAVHTTGSIRRRPELPAGESDAIVVGRFSRHLAHLSPSGKSVYSEIVLTPTEVIKGEPDALKAGARNEDGKVIRIRYVDMSGNRVRRWGWHNLRH